MNSDTPWRARRLWLAAAGALVASAALPSGAAAELSEMVSRIKPSVVAVGTFQRTRSPAFRFLGTGFAVGDGSMIATNAHVLPGSVDDEQREVLAIAVPGQASAAIRQVAVLATDGNRDLALLKLDGVRLSPLSLASGEGVREGQNIAFTGFPIGAALGLAPVTHRGIIAAVAPIALPQANSRNLNPALVRRLAGDAFHIYQLDATAYPGNSGSPLFDPLTGEVLGVVNMVFVKSTRESALTDPSGISYAIPASHLKGMLERLR